jgi:hypothetical protein
MGDASESQRVVNNSPQQPYDKSGMHDFNTDMGLKSFVSDFCHGNKDACILAVLANWRGDDALSWFTAEVTGIPLVDGWGPSIVSGGGTASARHATDNTSVPTDTKKN